MGVTWTDGRLAAKQLFDALDALGIKPEQRAFVNWFEAGGPERVRELAADYRLVAMGRKVQMALDAQGIAYIALVHPAARGRIRRKEIYAAHVAEMLGEAHGGDNGAHT